MFGLGSTFLIGDGSHLSHLWLIITTPQGPDEEFLIVNLTTFTEHKEDLSCILDVGEHPFIQHKTVVNYHDARTGTRAALTQNSHLITQKEDVSPTVLRKIQQGALASRFLKTRFRAMVERELQNPGSQP